MGLGLAISRTIVEAHGGKMRAENQPGRRRGHLLHPAVRPWPSGSMNDDPAIVHVVDDDAAWRRSVARLLVAAGYKTAIYDSAESFLDASLPDAPAASCWTFACRVSAGCSSSNGSGPRRASLPIVFLSGHADIPLTVQAVKAGAQDLLTKPVASDVLLRAVTQAIARDLESRASRAHPRRPPCSRALVDGDRTQGLRPGRARQAEQADRRRARHDGAHRQVASPQLHAEAERLDRSQGLVSLAEQLGMTSRPTSLNRSRTDRFLQACRRRRGGYLRSGRNICRQSFFMLTTVHPRAPASSSPLSSRPT